MTTPRPDLTAVLENTALFKCLSISELKLLATRTVRKLFRAGELLFSEGGVCNGLHIVLHGKVRIFKTSASGREQVLTVSVAGECVAELPVFDGGPFPASAIAIEDAEIAFISRRDFHDFCVEHPEVALKVLAFVGARPGHVRHLARRGYNLSSRGTARARRVQNRSSGFAALD